jgi:hypothetical protein
MAINNRGGIRISGIVQALTNLQKEMRKIEGRTKAGLIEAGFAIIRNAQERVPVDLGNLRSSGYVLWDRGNKGPTKQWSGPEAGKMQQLHAQVIGEQKSQATRNQVVIGFTAFYAIYVHEDLTVNHSSGEAKFLQKAIESQKDRVIRIVQARAT